MRLLGRFLALMVLLSLAGGAVQLGRQHGVPLFITALEGRSPSRDIGLDSARSSITYVSARHKEGWLEFPLTGAGETVKVLTTANLSSPALATIPPDTQQHYALRYQLLAADNEILEDRIYHHRTRVLTYQEPATGERLTPTFYLLPQLVPAISRTLQVGLYNGHRRAARLRLKLLQEADPAIVDVGVRVYQQEEITAYRLSLLWQRQSPRQQEFLARASVYGRPELLHEQEKRNLLRQRWLPVGPGGIQNQDYRVRQLYSRQDYEAEPAEPFAIPAGVYVDRHRHGMIPLPETGGTVVLRLFSVAEPAPELPDQAWVQVRWYGPGLRQRMGFQLPLRWRTDLLRQSLQGGILEVMAPRPLTVRAFVQSADGEQEITPARSYLRLYRMQPDTPLEYTIDHVNDQSTPLRIDLRVDGNAISTAAPVGYRMLDRTGRMLEQGLLPGSHQPSPLPPPFTYPSRYDRLQQPSPGDLVSEPIRYYFSIPSNIGKIQLFSSAPTLAAVYTRPPDLAREIRVPQDYRYFDPEDRGQPAWFPLWPDHGSDLLRQQRSTLLILQPRPPEDNPAILTGRYEWRDYYPQGNWRGRYLLNPRDPETPVREQALGTTFRPLSAGRSVELTLRSRPGRQQLEPSLLFLRSRDSPFSLQVFIDNKLLYQNRLAGNRGEIRLPAMAAGRHRIRLIASQPAQWLINYADVHGESYIRRLAYRFDKRGLEFLYRKETAFEEILSARLQLPGETDAPTRLGVTVEARQPRARGPLAEWSLLERIYTIQPDAQGVSVPVLGTPSQWVDPGRVFFIPLGSDLPPGNYRIRFRLEAGFGGYLSFYRVIAGVVAQREFFNAEPLDD